MFDATLTPPINFVYTQPMPCPYIDHKIERRLATDISTIRGKKCHNILAQAGFRRSQHLYGWLQRSLIAQKAKKEFTIETEI